MPDGTIPDFMPLFRSAFLARCNRCQLAKPPDAFNLRSNGKPQPWCKSCARAYYAKNRDAIAAKSLGMSHSGYTKRLAVALRRAAEGKTT